MVSTAPTSNVLGHDVRRVRERLAAADSAGTAVPVAVLLREGFLPSAVLQGVTEGLRYSPLWLRFACRTTQRDFIAERVEQSQTAFSSVARTFFIIVVMYRVAVLLFDILNTTVTDTGPTKRALTAVVACAFAVLLAALLLEAVAFATQVYSWVLPMVPPKTTPPDPADPATSSSEEATPAAPCAKSGTSPPKCQRGMSIRYKHLKERDSPRGNGNTCSSDEDASRAGPQNIPTGWSRRTTFLYLITSYVTGLTVALIPLVTMAGEYALSRDGGCAAGMSSYEEARSPTHRVFYCRFIVRPFIVTTISFSMIMRSPQFPMVLLSSVGSIVVMIMRSFSVLSDPDVPSVLRVFQFLMVLLLVLAHVVFRWVLDRAVLDEFVNRRTVEAQVEQLRYENATLEAFAAEKYPTLRAGVANGNKKGGQSLHTLRAGSSQLTSPHQDTTTIHQTQSTARNPPTAVHEQTYSTSATSAASAFSATSITDLIAARDYSPAAVVVAVRLHDFARFGHRHGVRAATSVSGVALLARAHEAVCGVEGACPDLTERHWDTYIAVFGFRGTMSGSDGPVAHQILQRHALHGARCVAAVAALDEKLRLQAAGGEPSVPELSIALHVGAILGEYPGTSVSAQRYCHRGPAIDGALAMLAACRSPDDMILLSHEAVTALGGAVVDAGAPDTVFQIYVHGDRFNAPPQAAIRVHAAVSIELDPEELPGEQQHQQHNPSAEVGSGDEHVHEEPTTTTTNVTTTPALPTVTSTDESPIESPIRRRVWTGNETPIAPPAQQVLEGPPTVTSLPLLQGGSLSTLQPNMTRPSHSAAQPTAAKHPVRALNDCLSEALQIQEQVVRFQRQRLTTESTLACTALCRQGDDDTPAAGFLPLRFRDPSVEHRYRNHFQQCGVLRLPHRMFDGFFLFLGLYTLIDFFVGVPFWDHHAAASFGLADELRLFSPKHVAAVVLLLLWESVTLAGAVVRYRQRPVAWVDGESAASARGPFRQSLYDLWHWILLSHTLRYTAFVVILLLFQPSTFSMNPAFATIVGIGAFYLEPIPERRGLLRLACRHIAPNIAIIGMIFYQPLYFGELFLGTFVALWPLAALAGRLSQDRMDRTAFAVTERATAYRQALRRQQGLREQVLDSAATPALRQLLSHVYDAAIATNSSSEEGSAGGPPPLLNHGDAVVTDELAATRGPQTRAVRPGAHGPQTAAAAGRPAAMMQLDHAVIIDVRFDPITAANAHPPDVSGELAIALACLQQADCFAAFLAVLDDLVQRHPPLSVIEARGELVMLGGPWGAAKATASSREENHSQEHYAATALAFLADLRAAVAAMPHYGSVFTVTTAATAEDALVLMRSTLYPSVDLLGPGPECVMMLLRAAVPGASATAAALHRVARNPTSFAQEGERCTGSGDDKPLFNSDSRGWAIREGGILVRVF